MYRNSLIAVVLWLGSSVVCANDILPISSWSPPTPAPFEHLTSNWDPAIFANLGGFSPWFPSTGVYGVPGQPGQVPEGCKVDQVQLYMRHAEREASGGTQKGIAAVAAKLANATFES